ncbi:MAG: hypothetical protein JJT89_14820 [Nitriliruptoraceae bacterium]|nr:hypothetical protein [Nitriliruptoraceae bacterium]
MGENSWLFLIVGTFAAVGAAMALGTLAALVRYHRTGIFPGAEAAAEVSSRRVTALWIRVGVGVVLTIIGVVAIVQTGIF